MQAAALARHADERLAESPELRRHLRTVLALSAAGHRRRVLGIDLGRADLRRRRAAWLGTLVCPWGVPALALALAGLRLGLRHDQLLAAAPSAGWVCFQASVASYLYRYWRHHVLTSAAAALQQEAPDEDRSLQGTLKTLGGMRIRSEPLEALTDALGDTAVVAGAAPPKTGEPFEAHGVRGTVRSVSKGVVTLESGERVPLQVPAEPEADQGRSAYRVRPRRGWWASTAELSLWLGGVPCVCALLGCVAAAHWLGTADRAEPTRPSEHAVYASVVLLAGLWTAVNAPRIQRQLQQDLTTVAWLSRHPLNDSRNTLATASIRHML